MTERTSGPDNMPVSQGENDAARAVSSDLFAALDLGSNSFHLLLARRRPDGFETVERIKDKVQLLAAFRGGRLDAAAMERGLACLARFAQRLSDVPRANLRVAGTHALRVAGNRAQFTAAAEATLGVPLEVISGDEEARLVYLGVAHHVPREPDRSRLVVDVGGGSTELAWGDGDSAPGVPTRVASFKVGCVSLTDACIASEPNQAVAFVAARKRAVSALRGLEPVSNGVDVVGTSGTVESVQSVLAANGWSADHITRQGLGTLTDAIVSGRWLVDAGLPGLAPERVDIFAAGLAVVDALFHVLRIERMRFVDVSLQDGLLYRYADPPSPGEDLRRRSVARLQARYRVDVAQAARVRATALALFDHCPPGWPASGHWRDLLGWAADLHEVGMVVAPRHYHRHGAYLVQHSDMPAFSHTEHDQLALLIRGHRRAFPGLAFRAYDDGTRRCLIRLLALLRVAVILHRGHGDADSGAAGIGAAGIGAAGIGAAGIGATAADAGEDVLRLELPEGWLAAHPLSARELEVEVAQLAGAGITLTFQSSA